MYNLLITSSSDAWKRSPYRSIGLQRFLQYTDPEIKAAFQSLDANAIARLCDLPTLFMYEETPQRPGWIGRVTSVAVENGGLVVSFKIDDRSHPISWDDLNDLMESLEIDHTYELGTTHWAIKKPDLIAVLSASGILPGPDVTKLSTERAALLDLVEELRLGLMSRATGGTMDAARYRELRQTLVGAPAVQGQLPKFLRVCRTPDDFWNWIKAEYSSYGERRKYLSEAFQPLLQTLEGVDGAAQANLTFGDLIGRGGFGAVFRVRHELLEMDFAVKVFEPSFDDGRVDSVQRFFREARLLFALNHSSIVRIYDAGFHQRKPFIRMELCEGKNLNRFLQDHGLLPPSKALALVDRILDGLAHAHVDAKVIHRDLKPSNIILAKGERVKIVDFGLGVFVEQDLVSRITKTGEAVAGGYYTAPELLQNPQLLDPRTDLYSVSAIWYTALVGRPPAGSDVVQALRKAAIVPEAHIKVLERGLASIDERFQSSSEMLQATRALRNPGA